MEIHFNARVLKVEALDAKRRAADKTLGELTASVEFAYKAREVVKSDQEKGRARYEAQLARMSIK